MLATDVDFGKTGIDPTEASMKWSEGREDWG